jgi:GNAT superfamily N-acetyltransferase
MLPPQMDGCHRDTIETMTLERAIEVFVRAFSIGKSQTHPYPAERFDGIWVLKDGPGRKTPRKMEVITSGLEPADAVDRVRRAGVAWHFLCDISADESPDTLERIKREYKAQGYRVLGQEWMFVHDLTEIPHFECDPPVRMVETQAEASKIPQLASHKLKLLPGSRQFGVWDGARDYGWVRSVPIEEDAWTANLHVHSDVRRQGYGRALMSALLESDREHGVGANVLLASTAGSKLYPVLGYRQIATLQMFCPLERA